MERNTPEDDPQHPYARLPERFRPEEMISEQATRDPGVIPQGIRDPNWLWLIRYS